MRKWFFTLLLVVAIVLSACGGNDSATVEPTDNADKNMTEAEKVFQNNCATCHGSDLSGGAGPDLTEVGSRYSKEEIAQIIKNGKNSMPAGLIEGTDVELIASWLAQKKSK
ncbi:cytochrome c [Virgibacillus necropolis]|uniref:cytochrome c551 n=1 Tax=Virgibacillus necropolis TaxID=163877 RepID=UPI00384CB725